MSAAGVGQTEAKPLAWAAVQRGKATFQRSCAVCHGERADGKGPAAPELTPRPSDLTTLARRWGFFPAAQVEATLNGSALRAAHGSPMVFWGPLFLADAKGDQRRADQRVREVVQFIESIQVK